MDSNVENKGMFSRISKRIVSVLFKIKGRLAEKDITISIAPTEHINDISVEFANHLVIPGSNISEGVDF